MTEEQRAALDKRCKEAIKELYALLVKERDERDSKKP